MSPDSYPKPIHGFRRWWVRYAGSLAVFLLILFTAWGFSKLETQNDNLRLGNIQGCEQFNEIKALTRQDARRTITRATTVDTQALFPDADPAYLRELQRLSIEQEREIIAANRPSDCEARYPATSVLTIP